MSSSQPGAKLFVAFAILGGAFFLAHPFRQEGTRKERPMPNAVEEVVLRETPPPDSFEVLRPEAPTAEIQPTLLAPPPDAGQQPRLDEGFSRLTPPPLMARTYPGSMNSGNDPGDLDSFRTVGRQIQRIHQVRDGDTLEGLAEVYLGDRTRWREIFQANRALVEQPELLPLAARLVIPPKTPHTSGDSREDFEDRSVAQAPLAPPNP